MLKAVGRAHRSRRWPSVRCKYFVVKIKYVRAVRVPDWVSVAFGGPRRPRRQPTAYWGRVATVGCSPDSSPPPPRRSWAYYNVGMGGVDRKGQQLAMFPIERKRNLVWYKKLFKRLLNVSVLNAYILTLLKSHRGFRKTQIHELLAAHTTPKPITHQLPTNTKQIHCPAQYVINEKQNRLKRQCAVCKKRVGTYCKACNVAMCAFTCFEPYHASLWGH